MTDVVRGFTWVHLLISILFGMGVLTYALSLWYEACTGAETYVIFATLGALLAFLSTFAAIFIERTRNK